MTNTMHYLAILRNSSIYFTTPTPTGVIVSFQQDTWLPLILIGLIALPISIIFIIKPTWLFYFFMLFFVFGEVSFGNFLIELSLSNYFSFLAAIIVLIYGVSKKRFFNLLKSRHTIIFLLLFSGLFLIEIFSATANNAYKPLTTRVSHLSSILFILLIIRNRKTMRNGFILGMISIGFLSILTILAGFGLNPIGYQSPFSWGSTPWEDYIHRSIGLSNMRGGLHAIYILAFLPLIVSFTMNHKALRIKQWSRFALLIIAVLGCSALLVASYRSAWLGFGISLVLILFFRFKSLVLPIKDKIILATVILATVILVAILLFAVQDKQIFDNLYTLAFDIRSQGIEARLIQYNYVLEKMLLPSVNLIYGFGYDEFGNSFMLYVAQQGLNNPELFPWIHNFFLGLLFASGWLGFFIFLILMYFVFKLLYTQTNSSDIYKKIASSAIFSSLVGIFVVLLFTAEISGLQIIWILISYSLVD